MQEQDVERCPVALHTRPALLPSISNLSGCFPCWKKDKVALSDIGVACGSCSCSRQGLDDSETNAACYVLLGNVKHDHGLATAH